MSEQRKICPCECPKCGSDNLTYTDGYVHDEYYCHEVTCDDCGLEFKEWDKMDYMETTWEE